MLKTIKMNELKEMLTDINLPFQLWVWKTDAERGYSTDTYPRCVISPTKLITEDTSTKGLVKYRELQLIILSTDSLEPKVLELEEALTDLGFEGDIEQEYLEENDLFIYLINLEVER